MQSTGNGPWNAVKLAVLAAALALAAGLTIAPAEAHKPITSKYTYNEHVFPIVRDRCGSCHADGGVAPMSLLTFRDARPWAESIREELIADRMPPWFADPTGSAPVVANRGSHALSAKELDTMIVWATGGTPEGDPSKTPPPIPARNEWPAGTPDLILPMPVAYTMPADKQDETRDITLTTGLRETRWIKAADLLAGTPSMVHDASITVDNGPVLSVWIPGSEPFMLPAGTAFRLDAGATLRLRIHYKKSWRDERTARSDRSIVGLYFASPTTSMREVQALAMDAPSSPRLAQTKAARDVPAMMRLVAIRPQVDRPYGVVQVDARTASGARLPILRLRAARPEWPRRYWFEKPIEVPAGSRIEVSATPLSPAVSDRPMPSPAQERLRIALDFTAP